MPEDDDICSLRAYVDSGAQRAFTDLVGRRVNMVYSAALRQVHDPHVAEEVTQTVFVVLSQKAAELVHQDVLLSGWLLKTTRFAAIDARRRIARRQKYERQAAEMKHEKVEPPHNSQQFDVRVVLDEALLRLNQKDRRAIILRYFEGRQMADVAQILGVTEEAARQRVWRGIQRLRAKLAVKGAAVPEEAALSILSGAVAHTAPPGLALAAAQNALAASSSMLPLSAKGVLTLMAWTKTKLVAAGVAALLLAGGGAVAVKQWSSSGTRQVVLGGPHPSASGVNAPVPFWGQRAPSGTIKYAGPPITGYVKTADGAPMAGAVVILATPNWPISVYGTGQPNGDGAQKSLTDAQGKFTFRPSEKPLAVVVRSPQGFAAALASDQASLNSLVIEPWARVEGIVRVGRNVVPRARVSIGQFGDVNEWEKWHVDKQTDVICDDNGRFVLDRAVPGHNFVSRVVSNERMMAGPQSVDLIPGQTTIVNIGGNGRTVVGHTAVPVSMYQSRRGSLHRKAPEFVHPANWDAMPEEQHKKLMQAFWNTPKFKAWQQSGVAAEFEIPADGSIRIEDVLPGTYMLDLEFGSIESHFVERAGWSNLEVAIPPAEGADDDRPFDLGAIQLTVQKQLHVGDLVPEIVGRSLDGSSIRLSEFRGKYVLLTLWQSDRANSLETMDLTRAIFDRFANDSRVKVLGVNTSDGRPAATKCIEEHNIQWLQMMAQSAIPQEYTHSPATLFLIDPAGKLVAKNIDAAGAYKIIDQLIPTTALPQVHVDRQSPGTSQEPPQTPNNKAQKAHFTIIDGMPDPGSGPLDCLHDNRFPGTDNAPGQNFFFDKETLEGRLEVDLGESIAVGQINTYSRHKSTRAPQLYTVYGSEGTLQNFDPHPRIGTDPTACGWKKVAIVDSRPRDARAGGRYAVNISAPFGSLGHYRYLLFEMFATETDDFYGHTFFSEISVMPK